MSNLVHFLTDLVLDPKKQERFERNPSTIIEAARLSDTEKIQLNCGGEADITKASADELPTNEFVAVIGGCYLFDPGPDPMPDPDPPPPEPEPDPDPGARHQPMS